MTPPLCPICGMPYERAGFVSGPEGYVGPLKLKYVRYHHVGGRECEDWEPKE